MRSKDRNGLVPSELKTLRSMNYILYANVDGKFHPINIAANAIAANMLYATLIPEERLNELKEAVTKEHQSTGMLYQIREAGKTKIVFTTKTLAK